MLMLSYYFYIYFPKQIHNFQNNLSKTNERTQTILPRIAKFSKYAIVCNNPKAKRSKSVRKLQEKLYHHLSSLCNYCTLNQFLALQETLTEILAGHFRRPGLFGLLPHVLDTFVQWVWLRHATNHNAACVRQTNP